MFGSAAIGAGQVIGTSGYPVAGSGIAKATAGSRTAGISKVVFGATVELEEEETGERVTYQIVGEDEADLKFGRINIGSPIARALIGKNEGDTAEVQAPGGIKAYEIVAVQYI